MAHITYTTEYTRPKLNEDYAKGYDIENVKTRHCTRRWFVSTGQDVVAYKGGRGVVLGWKYSFGEKGRG